VTVSVVMPVFNGAARVADAVASVLRQRDVEFELLIHDDGSTDETAAVLEALAAADSRIDLSRGPNRGPAASRNHLLQRARAEYVAFLDHDDLWPDGRLGRQLARLERAPDAPAVMGETVIFDTLDSKGMPARTARSRRVLAGLLQAGLFRYSAVAATGGFAREFTVADDFDFLLRMIETCGPFQIDQEVAVWYRLHPGQWTADLELTAQATARALAHSLRRRRSAGATGGIAWRDSR
jgi:glycosyltransferase involved in cell wall biosynthesis